MSTERANCFSSSAKDLTSSLTTFASPPAGPSRRHIRLRTGRTVLCRASSAGGTRAGIHELLGTANQALKTRRTDGPLALAPGRPVDLRRGARRVRGRGRRGGGGGGPPPRPAPPRGPGPGRPRGAG